MFLEVGHYVCDECNLPYEKNDFPSKVKKNRFKWHQPSHIGKPSFSDVIVILTKQVDT